MEQYTQDSVYTTSVEPREKSNVLLFSRTLWTPVFEQKSKGVLPTMKVVWRTQLLSTLVHFVDDPTFADIDSIGAWDWYLFSFNFVICLLK